MESETLDEHISLQIPIVSPFSPVLIQCSGSRIDQHEAEKKLDHDQFVKNTELCPSHRSFDVIPLGLCKAGLSLR